MVSFFKNDPLKSQRETASALLHHAKKVWCYRRDTFSEEDTARFESAYQQLATLAPEKAKASLSAKDARIESDASSEHVTPSAKNLDAACEEMHSTLSDLGGNIYPVRFIPEWVELIIVAAIIACGVRSFFLQPFKIPTNSMYPTYHGMTTEVFPLDEDGPNGLHKLWRKFTLMTERIEARAPESGEVLIPLFRSEPVKSSEDALDEGWFGTRLLRSPVDVYSLQVDNSVVEIPVPKEFKFLSVVLKTYFPEEARLPVGENDRWDAVLRKAAARRDFVVSPATGLTCLRTRKTVAKGERVANFDVLTGDMVLVDRMSYNFVRPKAGDPFVFAVKNIPGLAVNGKPQDLYYIKRLAGTPGDTLQVKDSVLYRNGAPISGKPAFDKNNAQRTDLEYYGYRPGAADTSLAPLDKPRHLPPASYFAMGDNSGGSYDSRGWGYVPEKEIVGRGFFILYPFTRRWGPAE
jgi:signal peptidase I